MALPLIPIGSFFAIDKFITFGKAAINLGAKIAVWTMGALIISMIVAFLVFVGHFIPILYVGISKFFALDFSGGILGQVSVFLNASGVGGGIRATQSLIFSAIVFRILKFLHVSILQGFVTAFLVFSKAVNTRVV